MRQKQNGFVMKTKNLSLQEACHVLSAWTALEVLTPKTFQKQKDLTNENQSVIASFDTNILPWEKIKKISDNKNLHYQVVIGAIDYPQVVTALLKKYPDQDVEKPQAKANAVIAVVHLDRRGCLLKAPSISISSFAWGIALALKGNLKEIGDWIAAEEYLLNKLDKFLRRIDSDEKDIPLDRHIIQEAYHLLIDLLEIPAEFVNNKHFVIKENESDNKKQESLLPMLLNSFYLEDLRRASSDIANGKASKNLERYLGINTPSIRNDILNDKSSLEAAVSPKFIPPARWPGMGRHPLVLLQQAAVNLALNKLKNGGILAINGPPGTGKTTLLRDVIAGLLTQRAEAMCTFDKPSSAFTSTNKKLKAGQGWFDLFSLDEKLKGFEMFVASSNNKAVENISMEFPKLKVIADDADALRYFKILSDKLYACESWGLISAVLGNGKNRSHFAQTFWWDEEVGFERYLREASGTPQILKVKDPKGKEIIATRPPKIVQENNPPRSDKEALSRWNQARKDFRTLLARCNAKLAELEEIRSTIQYLDSLDQDEIKLEKLEILLEKHQKSIPGFFSRIFRPAYTQSWKKNGAILSDKKSKVIRSFKYRERLGPWIVDKQSLDKEGLHLISPWCDQEMQLLRDQLFIEAIKLHKAFIDAAAKPLRHNLSNFLQYLKNPSVLKDDTISSIPDLWSSFFLVVPCVSTAFASIDRLLTSVPKDSLGWLLIDEAGQAVPQAAVGAIMRTKRAVIVGDPMQIEPIVSLSSNLTQNICKQFQVDPDRFNAPNASVQTLADSASSYFTEFESKYGSRSVGVPLLVHRRCSEPMFSIANAVAYDHLMVQAKRSGASSIRDCLGPSSWFDISAESEEKWCQEEGEKLLELLFKLKATTAPDLFVVTPFRIVGEHIRKVIKESRILYAWGENEDSEWVSDRVGTVHVMQGREAEAVIFVLGAPSKDHSGARKWAGSKPNLLNVAVTRAKEAIYVIGNRKQWFEVGVFKELSDWVR